MFLFAGLSRSVFFAPFTIPMVLPAQTWLTVYRRLQVRVTFALTCRPQSHVLLRTGRGLWGYALKSKVTAAEACGQVGVACS